MCSWRGPRGRGSKQVNGDSGKRKVECVDKICSVGPGCITEHATKIECSVPGPSFDSYHQFSQQRHFSKSEREPLQCVSSVCGRDLWKYDRGTWAMEGEDTKLLERA